VTKAAEPSKLAPIVKKVGSRWRLWVLVLVGLLAIYEVGFVYFIHSNLWWDIEYNQPRWVYAPLQYLFAPRMALKLYPIRCLRHRSGDGKLDETDYWIGRGDIRVDLFWPDGQLMARTYANFDGRIINGDYFDEKGKLISKIGNGTGTETLFKGNHFKETDYQDYRTLIVRIRDADHSPRTSFWQQYDGDKHVGVLCLVYRGRRLPEPMRREDAEKLDPSALPAAVEGDMYAPGDPRSTWKLSQTNTPSAS